MSPSLILPVVLGLTLGLSSNPDDPKMKLADCPEAVQTTLKAEAGASKIESVSLEQDEEGESTYWIDVVIAGKPYTIGVLQNGTLSEITLGIDADEVAFDKLPTPVQSTFRSELFGQKVATVFKDLKYGISVFEAAVDHKGKRYQVVVAEDGTLVEKVLVIDDEEVDFAKCPAAVQATFTKHAGAGLIHEVTRYTGITKPVYEAEVEIKGKVYLIEVAESGYLISMSLEAEVEE